MNHISRVQVFYCFEQLIHNILLVDVLQYIASFYHIVQVSVYNFIHSTYIMYAYHGFARYSSLSLFWHLTDKMWLTCYVSCNIVKFCYNFNHFK